MSKVKVFCHTCDGDGFIEVIEYPSKKTIKVACPECNGKKWVYSEKLSVEVEEERE